MHEEIAIIVNRQKRRLDVTSGTGSISSEPRMLQWLPIPDVSHRVFTLGYMICSRLTNRKSLSICLSSHFYFTKEYVSELIREMGQ